MQTETMSQVIDLVNSEAGRLGDFLAGLEQGQWLAPSACEGWVAGDVAAHLAQGGFTWADSITRAVAGNSGPPAGQQALRPGERGSDETAQRAISFRQDQGQAGLLRSFRDGYASLREVTATLTPEDWDKPCFHRRGVMIVSDYVALRLQELAVHSWDIRSGLDPAAAIFQETLPVLVGRVQRWLTNSYVANSEFPAPTRYRIDVSGPVPVQQDVLVNSDSFSIEGHGDGPADVTFRCDTGTYILLVFGRLDLDSEIGRSRMNVEGDPERAAQFNAWFPGF
jgi:uncharacterized protein (TIGR03083 family)